MNGGSTGGIKKLLSNNHFMGFDPSFGDSDDDNDTDASQESADNETPRGKPTPTHIIQRFKKLALNRDFVIARLDLPIKHLQKPNNDSYFLLHLLLKLDPETTLPRWVLSNKDIEPPNREALMETTLTEAVNAGNALAKTLEIFYNDGATEALCSEIFSQLQSPELQKNNTFLALLFIVTEHPEFNRDPSQAASIPIQRNRAKTSIDSHEGESPEHHPSSWAPSGKKT